MAPPRPPRRFPVSDAALADFAASMFDNLLTAAYEGDLPLLKRLVRLLDQGEGRPRDVVEAARLEQGLWALPVAASNGQMEVCRYLVQGLRVDVDAADDEGRTALVYAVISENSAVVKYLLDHGADPNKADDDRLTPLHSAAGLGDCEMIEMLLTKGAYVDPIADGIGTPLHLATNERQVGAMKTLLDHNADPKKTYMMYGLYPMTPLFQAVNVSSVECVKLLVEAGAVINSDCVTTVLLDSKMGDDDSTECLNFLLEACAKRDAPNNDKHENTWKIAQLKSFGSKAVERKDYFSASAFYTKTKSCFNLLDEGAFACSTRAMERRLCRTHLNEGSCGLTGQRPATGMVPLWCHWRSTGARAKRFWMVSSWTRRMPRWSVLYGFHHTPFCIVACMFRHISMFVICWKHVVSAACSWSLCDGISMAA